MYFVPRKTSNISCIGRPIGGLTIFVRKSLQVEVRILASSDHFCVSRISTNSYSFDLVNIYMPCDSRSDDSVTAYQTLLGDLKSVKDDVVNQNLVMVGDYNADMNKGRMFSFLSEFVHVNDLIINNQICLNSDSFTYLSPMHKSTSWIDHIVSSQNVAIENICVM